MCPSPRYMPSKYVYARFGMSAESAAFDSRKMNGRGGRIRTCKSLRTEGFKPSAYCQFRHAPVMVILTGRLSTPPPLHRGGGGRGPTKNGGGGRIRTAASRICSPLP